MKCSLSQNIHEISLNFVTSTSAGVGPLWSPMDAGSSTNGQHVPTPTSDRKGPHPVHPAALAPTVFQVGIIFYIPL